MTSWIVLRTQPRREQWACFNVERQGLESYCPWYQPSDQKCRRALFTSYIFAKLRQEGQWWFLKGTYGVLYPIMDGNKPKGVSVQVIEELKKRERNGVIEIEAKEEFTKGQILNVVMGPLLGMQGVYQGMTPKQRVKLVVQIFGTQREVPIDRSYVEAMTA